MAGTVTSNITNITLAESGDSANWDDLGGGQGSAQSSDAPIQGSETRARRVDNASRGFGFDNGAAEDISASGVHVGFWAVVLQPGQIGATQGLEFSISDSATGCQSGNWDGHHLAAADYIPQGVQGVRVWIDVSRTRDAGSGTLTLSSARNFGCEFEMGDVGGNAPNCHLDRIDHTSAGLTLSGGTSGSPAEFADLISDDATNRYGIIDDNFLNGPITLGGANSYFEDSNFALKAGNQPLASSTFITITIDLASATSDINWLSGFLQGIGLTISGSSGVFDMGTVTMLLAPAIALNSVVTWAGKLAASGQLTWGGAILNGLIIENSSAASALLMDTNQDPNGETDNMSFVSDGSGHAIELGSNTPATITLTGHSYSGYATTDGSTGDEVIYNNSGKAITINYTGDQPTIRNGTGASTTLVNSISWTLRVVSEGSAVQNAEVTITDDATNPNVLYHLEDTPATGLATYTFDAGDGGNDVVILIMKFDREPYSLDTKLPTAETTTDIDLDKDRVAINP